MSESCRSVRQDNTGHNGTAQEGPSYFVLGTVDVKQAIALLRQYAASVTPAAAAREIGLQRSAVTRWLNDGDEPKGKNRRLLLEWAAQRLYDAGARAGSGYVREPARDAYALGVLRGQAEAVRRHLLSALAEHDKIMEGLDRMGVTPGNDDRGDA